MCLVLGASFFGDKRSTCRTWWYNSGNVGLLSPGIPNLLPISRLTIGSEIPCENLKTVSLRWYSSSDRLPIFSSSITFKESCNKNSDRHCRLVGLVWHISKYSSSADLSTPNSACKSAINSLTAPYCLSLMCRCAAPFELRFRRPPSPQSAHHRVFRAPALSTVRM